MSDTNETKPGQENAEADQQASLPTEAAFAPDPLLSVAADDAETETENQTEESSGVSPKDETAAYAELIAGLGKTVEESSRANQEVFRSQFNTLSEAVLDAADVASKSAKVANQLSSEFKQGLANVNGMMLTVRKNNLIVIGACAGLAVLSLIIFILMGVRMGSRMNQLDVMLTTVGKRAVELNTGLDTLDTLNQRIIDLSAKQEALTKTQAQVDEQISAALKKSEAMIQQMPARAAQQMASTSAAVTKEVQTINTRLQQQGKAVQVLGDEVKELKGNVANVTALRRDVQALVTLQKDRYLEQLQKQQSEAAVQSAAQAAAKSRESIVQFPRPKAQSNE